MNVALERFVGAFVMRMLVLLVVDDSQHFAGGEMRRALISCAQCALPIDLLRNLLPPVVDKAVLRQNVQLQPSLWFCFRRLF